MKSTLFFILSFLFFNTTSVFSQDTIVELSGVKIAVSNLNYNDSTKMFSYINKKSKIKAMSVEGVFSVIDSTGKEKVYYAADSLIDKGSLEYTTSEMRDYMKGRILATNERKELFAKVGGFVFVGGVTYYALNTFIPIVPVIPVAYIAVANVIPLKESCVIKKHPEFKDNPALIDGYQDAVESKRNRKAVIGGTSGMVAAIIAKIIYDSVSN